MAVAYNNISRAGGSYHCGLGFHDNSWMLSCETNSYNFYHNSVCTPVSVPRSYRAGVYLDHRSGFLSFYSVSSTESRTHSRSLSMLDSTFILEALLCSVNSFKGQWVEFCFILL